MSKIKIVTNLDSQQILIQKVSFQSGKNSLEFLFNRNDSTNVYLIKGLRFSYELKSSGVIKKKETFPPDEVEFEYVDATPLVTTEIEIEPDIVHTLTVNIQFNNYNLDHQEDIRGPMPEKPYPSWVWNGKAYQSPVQELDVPCAWDESSQSWKEILLSEYVRGPRDT